MSHYYYVSPEEFEMAERNGISRSRVYARIYYGWSKERALHEPVKPKAKPREMAEVAARNGIEKKLFYRRVNVYGWSEERAATEPKRDRLAVLAKAQQGRRTISPADEEVANRHGVSLAALHYRLRAGWDMETAQTTPMMTPSQVARMGGQLSSKNPNSHTARIFRKR